MENKTVIMGLVVFLMFTSNGAAFADQASQAPANLHIQIDISGSSPAIKNNDFPQRAGKYAAGRIEKLPYGSTISVALFGVFDPANSTSFNYQLLHRRGQEPREVAQKVSMFIANIPTLISKNKIQYEKETSIIGYLVKNKHLMEDGVEIILISDFFEETPELNIVKLLGTKKQLPVKPGLLSGVRRITGLGLGIGLKNLRQYEQLEKLWMQFFINSGMAPETVRLYSNKF